MVVNDFSRSRKRVVGYKRLRQLFRGRTMPVLEQTENPSALRRRGLFQQQKNRQRHLPCCQIGSQGLARRCFRSEQIEAIIENLVRGPNRQTKLPERSSKRQPG